MHDDPDTHIRVQREAAERARRGFETVPGHKEPLRMPPMVEPNFSGGVASNVAPAFAPNPPRINLIDDDGDAIRRFTADGPFEVWLMADIKRREADGRVSDRREPGLIELMFPNADIARDHLKPIGHAVAILNDVLARAFAARTEPIPDAATCHHHVRLERFARRLPLQATCDRCLTVLTTDVAAWLDENGYGSDDLYDRETTAKVIEEAANRGR